MSTSPLNSFISLVPWVYPLHLASLQCPFSFEGSYFLFLIYFPENKYTWCLLIFAFFHTQKVSCFDQLMSAEKSCVVSTQRLSSFLCIIAQATKVWIYQTEVFLSSVGGIFWPITSVLQWPNLNLQLLVTLACLFVGKIPKSGFQGGRVNVSIFRGKKANLYQWTCLWVITRLIFFLKIFIYFRFCVYRERYVHVCCCQIQKRHCQIWSLSYK